MWFSGIFWESHDNANATAGRGHPISQRRACVLIGVDPKTVRRDHSPDNPEIRLEMHKIAEKRRRFGYRRIGVMLERVGMVTNEKKLLLYLLRRRVVRPSQAWPQTGARQPHSDSCRKFRI